METNDNTKLHDLKTLPDKKENNFSVAVAASNGAKWKWKRYFKMLCNWRLAKSTFHFQNNVAKFSFIVE